VIREVIRTVDRPVVKRVIEPIYIERGAQKRVIQPVYIEKPRKKLNIPKYDYFGSTETKTYHKSSCRFRKLIKRKYQVSNNSPTYFKSRKFKPCKLCHPERKSRKQNKSKK